MSDSNLHQQNSNLHCPIPIYIGWIPISKVQIPIYIGWTSIYKVEIPIYIVWFQFTSVEFQFARLRFPIYIGWIPIGRDFNIQICCSSKSQFTSSKQAEFQFTSTKNPIYKVVIQSNLHHLNVNLHSNLQDWSFILHR